MSSNVYGLSEIVGTSHEGVDDAIRVGVRRAASTLRGLDCSRSPTSAGISSMARSSTSR